MRTRSISAAAILCAALVIVPAAVGETIEDVEKKLADMTAKVKSLSYKGKSETNLESSAYKMKQQMDMTCEYARKGDVWLSRVETKNRTEQDVAGTSKKSEGTSLTISDGEITWTYNVDDGEKQVVKMKQPPGSQNPLDIKAQFKLSREHYELKLLPDEKVDGRDCWVIEMTPKSVAGASNPMFGKMRQFYDKATGVQIKGVGTDGSGKQISSTTVTDVKVDAEISPDRFKFKAPEGVPVTDMTKPAEEAKPVQP